MIFLICLLSLIDEIVPYKTFCDVLGTAIYQIKNLPNQLTYEDEI